MPYHIIKPPTSTLIGTTVSGLAAVTGLASTSALYAGQPVSGPGIPAGASILSIGSSSQVTLSANATAAGTVSLAFGVEPVTLAEAKRHLQINFTDDDDDILDLITFARQDREAYLERSFLTTGWELILDGFPSAMYPGWIFGAGYSRHYLERGYAPGGIIELRKPPIQSVGDITYIDAAGNTQVLVSGVDFTVRSLGVASAPCRIYPRTGRRWPALLPEVDVVRIPFVAGYGNTADAVPECIKVSMRMLVEDKYKNRSAISDVANNTGEVPLTIDRICAAEDWGARV